MTQQEFDRAMCDINAEHTEAARPKKEQLDKIEAENLRLRNEVYDLKKRILENNQRMNDVRAELRDLKTAFNTRRSALRSQYAESCAQSSPTDHE